ncbi:hypothetical protein QVH35_07580 [Candidatus Nitrosotenuis chungbukensis]|uniref:hypothetical protein n=1 Tax=Candidatus Nitrosotenuis chungbukensis TaxID=1353246 RepID=UPI00069372FF|nr:hypothetical protein [Candidatus Nitrosotenuis chungbukensis]WKT57278.1 hypothetical protein QVH35_07580 [Candidatus Nitrosotenuis chungbukensis]
MLPLLGIALVIAFPAGAAMNPGGILSFYVYDDDLNTSHRGINQVSTSGLLEFTINGIPIQGPSIITETSQDSGIFVGRLNIPSTINGRPLQQGDTLVITYSDESDYSGNPTTVSKSIAVAKHNTHFSTSAKNIRIGQTFQVRIYDPDFNLDSRNVDSIPTKLIEFRTENGIRATLNNEAFEARTTSLRETGKNTNTFIVTVKMPKEIDGERLKIGADAQLRFTDTTSPSRTSEILKTNIRIGLR